MDNQVLALWNLRLDAIERLVRRTWWQKLPQLYYRLPKSYLMRKLGISQNLMANTFMDVRLKLPFPESNDLYLFGAKAHDSEIRLARFLLNTWPPPKSFIDIGAHVGYYSTLVSKRYPDCKIFAFEPSEVFPFLKANTHGNDQIEIYNLAVADSNRTLDFYEYELGNKEYNSFVLNKSDDGRPYRTKSVNAIDIDSFLEKVNAHPDLIKIDVEGGELMVLRGMTRVLKARKTDIIIEFINNCNSDIYIKVYNLLVDMFYQPFRIDHTGLLSEMDDPFASIVDSDNLVFIPKSE